MKDELEKLLNELSCAYEKSDIKNNKYCIENKRKWGFELIQSALLENKPMIIGFNWGVDKTWKKYINGDEYNNQLSIQKRSILKIEMGSLQRSVNMCKKHFPSIDFTDGSHSNFCFFRSEMENQISYHDIDLCKGIFLRMLEIVNPSVVFIFSSKARKYMLENKLIQNVKEKKIYGKHKRSNSFTVARGCLSNGANAFFLPHPNSRISKEIRNEAWKFCAS